MIAAAAAIAAAGLALLRGGSIAKLAATKFEALSFLGASVAAQLALLLFVFPARSDLHSLALILPPILIGAFSLANRRLPGMSFIIVGVVLNVAVIGVNGRMPVSSWAREKSGAGPNSLSSRINYYEPADPHTLVPELGDVIPIPWLHQIASPGDLLLAMGIGRFIYCRIKI